MRFSLGSLSLLAFAPLAVLGQEIDLAGPTELSKFTVVPSFPESSGLIGEFINDKETPITFTFTNQEDFPVHAVAFEGSFTQKGKDVPYFNLTTTELSPLLIEANGGQTFTTNLKLILPPTDFDLTLSFLLAFEGAMSTYTLEPIAVTVSDPSISILDPKLILATIILGLTVAGLGYFGVSQFLLPYLEEQKPVAKKQPVVVAEPEAVGVVPGEKGYDESWIPQHHLAGGKKSVRKTKNN